MRRLYAGSVSYDATEEDIKEMFKPFGNITCLTISWDEEKNHHKVNTFSIQFLQLTGICLYRIWLCGSGESSLTTSQRQRLAKNQLFRNGCFSFPSSYFEISKKNHCQSLLKGASINGRRIKLGRPQAALRYQYIFAQIEMEGRAMAQG